MKVMQKMILKVTEVIMVVTELVLEFSIKLL